MHAVAGPGHPTYAASKGALTRQAAVEHGPDVRVNCVLPDSGAHRRVGPGAGAGPGTERGQPEEVVSTIALLVSANASYVTSESLVVDEGWTVHKDSA